MKWLTLAIGLLLVAFVTAFVLGWIEIGGVSGHYLATQRGGHLLFWVVPNTLEAAHGIPRKATLARIDREGIDAEVVVYTACRDLEGTPEQCHLLAKRSNLKALAQQRLDEERHHARR